jgi:hypothetical protein
MKKIAALAATLVLASASAACSTSAVAPADASKERMMASPAKAKSAGATSEAARIAEEAKSADGGARQPGDFVVRRFSGSFRKAPITLTEKVFAREGATLVLDLTVDDGKKAETLRVWMSDAPANRGEVTKVARLDGAAETASDVAAYEAMMQKVTVVADQNEEMLGEADVDVDVAGKAMPGRERTFRVRLGKKQGTMRTVESARFPWGDLAAEISGQDGKLIYKAEIVETGKGSLPKGAARTAAVDEE